MTETPRAQPDDLVFNYASIGRRFVAMLLDGGMAGLVAFLLNAAVPVGGALLVLVLYAPIFESSELRATLGKYWMGVQVVDLSGGRITFRAALIRTFMRLVSGMLLFAGHLLAFFTERRQALHDLVSDTVVIYGRSERAPVDAWVDQLKAVFRGVTMSSPEPAGSARLVELERLHALRVQGALTEEEFQREKARLLAES
jgi:uncharacterized RDD family membrane protein YckC